MEEMKIEYFPVADLKPYERNAKIHPETQVEHIANSIQKFGFRQPLVIDKDGVVIIGHGRLLAAEKLGMETVPCVLADDLTEEEVKALRIADNKLNESPWDFSALEEELNDLELSFDMSDFGFGEATKIDWDRVDDLEEENYEEPEHEMLECPSCHHVDRKIHFKKV